MALGMVATLAAVVYAAFRAGSNSSLFTLDASEEGESDDQVCVHMRVCVCAYLCLNSGV